MSLKHTWNKIIKNDAGSAVATDNAIVILGEAEENFYVEVPPGQTAQVAIAIDVSEIRSAFVYSDTGTLDNNGDSNVTIFTNAADGATGQVIPMVAGVAFSWQMNDPVAENPFTPDITKFYITNDHDTKVAKVRGGFLVGAPE